MASIDSKAEASQFGSLFAGNSTRDTKKTMGNDTMSDVTTYNTENVVSYLNNSDQEFGFSSQMMDGMRYIRDRVEAMDNSYQARGSAPASFLIAEKLVQDLYDLVATSLGASKTNAAVTADAETADQNETPRPRF